MSTMLLSHLASHPDAPGPLLAALARPVLGDPAQRVCVSPEHAALRNALLGNPTLPLAALTALLTVWPDYAYRTTARPDIRPALAAAAEASPAGFLYAVANDPDGHLAAHAYALMPTPGMWRTLVEATHTPVDVKHAATLQLASCVAPTHEDRVAVAGAVSAHRDWAGEVAAVATSSELAGELAAIDRAYRDTFTEGTAAWFTSSAATPTAIATYATAHPGWGSWDRLRAWGHEPGQALVVAARAARRDGSPRAVELAGLVVQCSAVEPDDACAALSDLAQAGQLRQSARSLAATHLATAPLAFATEYAPHARTNAEFDALLTRTDLSPDILDVLTSSVTTPTRTDATLRPAGGRPEPWRQLGIRNPLLWGAALASHQCSTPAQRMHGLMLTLSAPTVAARGVRGPQLALWCIKLARAATALPTSSCAAVGGTLPLAAVNDPFLTSSPTVVALIGDALGAAMPVLSAVGAVEVLLAVAPTFPGTLTELFDTISAISADPSAQESTSVARTDRRS